MFRADKHKRTPFFASAMAKSRPMPLDAPVIHTTFPFSDAKKYENHRLEMRENFPIMQRVCRQLGGCLHMGLPNLDSTKSSMSASSTNQRTRRTRKYRIVQMATKLKKKAIFYQIRNVSPPLRHTPRSNLMRFKKKIPAAIIRDDDRKHYTSYRPTDRR